jgi:hypothetical protein
LEPEEPLERKRLLALQELQERLALLQLREWMEQELLRWMLLRLQRP